MKLSPGIVVVSVMLAVAGTVRPAGALGQPASPPGGAHQPAKDTAGAHQVDLRPKFTKGQQTRFIMTIESTGTTADADPATDSKTNHDKPAKEKPAKEKTKPEKSKPGSSASVPKPDEQTMRQEIGLLLRVKEADPDKGATIELVYESLKVALKTADMDVNFDSTKKPTGSAPTKPGKSKPGAAPDPDAQPSVGGMPSEDELVESALRPMVGQTITMQVDKDGNIVSSSGGSGLSMGGMASMLGGMTGGMGGAGLAGGGGGGDAALGSLFTVAKGKSSAAVGESWTTNDTLDASVIGSFRITNKTTVKSASRGLAELAFDGRIDPGTQGGPGPLSGMAQVQESGFTGQATWDTDRGMLKTMTSQQRVVLDATVPDVEVGQKTVRLTSRSTVKVRRVD